VQPIEIKLNSPPRSDIANQMSFECCSLLLAKEKKEREEAERKKKELEEQLNEYTSQYENARRGNFLKFCT
jgi:hypothetical protein